MKTVEKSSIISDINIEIKQILEKLLKVGNSKTKAT